MILQASLLLVDVYKRQGYVDEEPVRAKITGILRGILKSGLIVSDHFKLADVDARCEESHCYSISDKSLAVGGGVLEAVTAWDYERLSLIHI